MSSSAAPLFLELLYSHQMTLGTRIRKLRNENNLTQDRIAEICGATKSAVSQWESDTTTPTLGNLLLLRGKLAFSFDWLLSDAERLEPSTTITACEPLPAPYVHSNETTRRIIALLDQTDEAGRGVALYAITQALKEYQPIKQTAA